MITEHSRGGCRPMRSVGRGWIFYPNANRRLGMTKASSRAVAQKSRSRLSSSDRWWILILGGGAIAIVLLIVFLLSPRAVNTAGLDGLVTYNNLSRAHNEAPQKYEQIPPAGGTHSAGWQNCGI